MSPSSPTAIVAGRVNEAWQRRFDRARRRSPSSRRARAGRMTTDLVIQEPLRDPNIIYNFLFMSPHIFTHQGATGRILLHWLRGVRYPSSPESSGARRGAGAG